MAKPYVEDPLIRSMRVRTWFQAVGMASGKTPAQLEREFSEREDPSKRSPRSCIWEKYRRGEVVPRLGIRKGSRSNVAERVEERYPETKKWLVSPLWRAADSFPMTIAEVRNAYAALPDDIASLFVVRNVDEQAIFWRRPVDAEAVCSLLTRSLRPEALSALLIMVKEAETRQDPSGHRIAVIAVLEWLRQISRQMELGTVAPELTQYLTARWQTTLYPTTSPSCDLPLFQ